MGQLTSRVRPPRGKHAQDNCKSKIRNSRYGNWFTKYASVKFAWIEFSCSVSPDKATENGHTPGDIVAGDGQREESVGCGGVDQSQ